MNKRKICCICDEKTTEPMVYNTSFYCEECFYDKFIVCESCEDTINLDDARSHPPNGGYYCAVCYNESFFRCYECSDSHSLEIANQNEYDRLFCEDCFFESHDECSHCNDYRLRDNGSWIDDEFYCDNCEQEQRLIKPYSYRPIPIFHTSKNEQDYDHYDKTEKRLVFGFELEVENKGEWTHEYCAEQLKEIGKGLIYFKEDSSITNGFEIVSHPISFDYYKENKQIFIDLLNKAVKLGLRSYNTTTCGLHISICRKAFTHSHFLKFVNFFNSNKNHNILKTISQRLDEQLHWCKLGNMTSKNELIKFSKVKNNGQSLDRYLALNLNNSNRLEVRLFRGTLKADSFFKAFETIFAIYNFCKQMSFKNLEISSKNSLDKTDEKIKNEIIEWRGTKIAQISPNLVEKRFFNTFVHKNKKHYKNLDLFLSEKYSSFYNSDKSQDKIDCLNKMLKQNNGGYFQCV